MLQLKPELAICLALGFLLLGFLLGVMVGGKMAADKNNS